MNARIAPCLAAAALLLACRAVVTAAPADGEDLAPRSTYVLDLPFLHFGGMERSVPPAGALLVGASGTYANTFSHTYHAHAIKAEFGTLHTPLSSAEAATLHVRHPQEVILFLDAEVLRAALTAEVGLGRGVSLGVEVPYLDFSTVSGDGAILAFHRAFGLTQAQRDDFPTGGFLVVLQAPHGPLVYEDRRPSRGIGDATATARWRREAGESLTLEADVALKLPTGDADSFRGSGSADAGAMLGIEARSGRQSWFVQAGAVVPGAWRGALPYRPAPFARVLAGAAREIGSRTSLHLAATWEESPLRREGLGDVSRPAVEAVLGFSRRFGERFTADLALDEHLPWFGDGTDVALRLALSWR